MTKLYHTCDDCKNDNKNVNWIQHGESGSNRWVDKDNNNDDNKGNNKGNNKDIVCPRCEETMNKFTTCHMICPNCGAHLDCSDKGSFW
tara:strand:+ start:545 stop:808 length:264 start_codon:yes stop_codon:yes gene_type:complete